MPDFAKPFVAPSQTLVRGLDVLELVANGPLALSALARQLGLARSTAHRLAAALLERRYLTFTPLQGGRGQGYGLGPKLLELGALAQAQTDLLRIAKPMLDQLACQTLDSAFLCVPDGDAAVLLLLSPGKRRLLPSLSIGERFALQEAAPGRALLLEKTALPGIVADADAGPDQPRMIAAPVLNANGVVVASLGLAAAGLYLTDARLEGLGATLRQAAAGLGTELGRPAGKLQHLPQNQPQTRAKPLSALEDEAPRVHDNQAEFNRSLQTSPLDASGGAVLRESPNPRTLGRRSDRGEQTV